MGASKSRASQMAMSEFAEACRKAGLKLTHQRLEIYKEIAAATDHPSAEDLYRRESAMREELRSGMPMKDAHAKYGSL